MKTVVGLFDSRSLAQSAIDDLIDSGFQRESINIMASDDERERWTGEEEGYFEEGSGRAMGRYSILSGGTSSLTGLGVEEHDAQIYSERVSGGGFLVAVSADEGNAQKAADILSRYGAIDIDERASLRQEGVAHEGLASRQEGIEQGVASRQETDLESRSTLGQEGVIPVVEEEIQVGKRQIQKGGIRVYSHISETPVAEEVQLHEEHARVERRPVDRLPTEADQQVFQERSFEIRETAEEPVVSKQARVKEEVVVGTESSERTEVIRDTLRRTDVEVENLEGRYGQQNISAMDDDEFMTHFTSTYGGERFDEPYRSAYHFAESESASHPQLGNKEWFEVEEEVHRDWELSHPGTWNRVQEAIHFGWDRNLRHHGHH